MSIKYVFTEINRKADDFRACGMAKERQHRLKDRIKKESVQDCTTSTLKPVCLHSNVRLIHFALT